MDIQKNNANERAEESPMAGSGSEMAAVMTTPMQYHNGIGYRVS